MYALSLDSENRVLSAWEVLEGGSYTDMPVVKSLPAGNIADYLYVDEQYVFDPIPEPPQEPEHPETNVWDELDAAYQEGVDSI